MAQSKENFSKMRYSKHTVINRNKSSNPLARLSYRELQREATELNLPANLKHKLLLSLVIATKTGRKDIVDLILQDRNEKMNQSTKSLKRRSSTDPSTQPPEKRIFNDLDSNVSRLETASCSSTFNSFSSAASSKDMDSELVQMESNSAFNDENLDLSFSPNSFTRIIDLFQNFNNV